MSGDGRSEERQHLYVEFNMQTGGMGGDFHDKRQVAFRAGRPGVVIHFPSPPYEKQADILIMFGNHPLVYQALMECNWDALIALRAEILRDELKNDGTDQASKKVEG